MTAKCSQGCDVSVYGLKFQSFGRNFNFYDLDETSFSPRKTSEASEQCQG
jgi:hypothetical protein